MNYLIVTGVSGSGKSTAINVLEDIGYYCIDNMPPELISKFAQICNGINENIQKVAFVVDIRGGDFFLKLNDTINELRSENADLKILFLDSSDDCIVRRYKETRRKHPLDEVSYGNIRKAIATERELLSSVRGTCDYYVDTSTLSVAQFKERMYSMFLEDKDDFIHIDVMSFGFKYGTVSDADLVFDVRCLPNPFYIPELKHKTGLQNEVSGYVMSFDESQKLLEKLEDIIDFLIPLYIKEGKAQIVIAFGCTGGKHRSVTFAEKLGKHLFDNGHKVRISHRDIEKH
ncbi:MAG: RNase adapter RapZ [Oscillospiraceae bacterium]|nr:RNase adapter RapZ [Oscillospiraceae bacterium]